MIQKRWRATAVQDAGAFHDDSQTPRSVMECASPLALWPERGENGMVGKGWARAAVANVLRLVRRIAGNWPACERFVRLRGRRIK
jgi:hypothetical protein